MKRIRNIITILFLTFAYQIASSQTINPTGGASVCKYCLPSGWAKDVNSNFNPSISDMTNWAGDPNASWNPGVQGVLPSALGTFLTVYNSPTVTETCHTTITGLTAGKTYYLKYSVMSSKSDYSVGASYGASAKVEFSLGASGSQVTEFVAGVNTSSWITKMLAFTPTSSTVRLTFSGKGPAGGGGYLNLDIGFNSIKEYSDLTPSLETDGLSLAVEANRDFVINLFEINKHNTSGSVSVRISKLGGFTITYPTQSGVSNVYGGTQNENSKWSFSETNYFITATSVASITSNGKAAIGFNVKRNAGISPGTTQNITATILSGSGGEINSSNNMVVTSFSAN
jgi:hypothetical protein